MGTVYRWKTLNCYTKRFYSLFLWHFLCIAVFGWSSKSKIWCSAPYTMHKYSTCSEREKRKNSIFLSLVDHTHTHTKRQRPQHAHISSIVHNIGIFVSTIDISPQQGVFLSLDLSALPLRCFVQFCCGQVFSYTYIGNRVQSVTQCERKKPSTPYIACNTASNTLCNIVYPLSTGNLCTVI